jgi:hypothetical protein
VSTYPLLGTECGIGEPNNSGPSFARKIGLTSKCILGIGLVAALWLVDAEADDATSNIVGWVTNGAFVSAQVVVPATNTSAVAQPSVVPKSDNAGASPDKPAYVTNTVFHHFVADSLSNLVWTNLMARTNGRDTTIWSVRTHSSNWPATPPVANWNTNSLIWGMRGLTALSPCWEVEGAPGQVPVTALTRRHGYTRGHGMGADGFNTGFAGKKVWFLTANNKIVEATVARDVVRTFKGSGRDYTILLFRNDLPSGIQPLSAADPKLLFAKYKPYPYGPVPFFKTEQTGHVSVDLPGLKMDTWKGGDSGSPDMLPLPAELVFCLGRSTSGPSPEMQTDMDELCMLEGLNPKRYQLQWANLAKYPTY